jgi:glycosyltransferase involved in cell wall biosynthesis
LRRRGIGAQLTIVGMSPPEGVPAGITIIPPLNKARLADRELLACLYRESHFFILPTRAEGYGIVFAEAAAHALPSLSFRLTGVESSVLDGVSGTLLEPGANAEQFADVIEHYLSRSREYQRLCRSARNFYETEANWPRASREMLDIIGWSLRERERKVEAASLLKFEIRDSKF